MLPDKFFSFVILSLIRPVSLSIWTKFAKYCRYAMYGLSSCALHVHFTLVDMVKPFLRHIYTTHTTYPHIYKLNSTSLESFFTFWRRIFKRKTTDQNEMKPRDHDQPQVESSQELSESEDDDSSDLLNSSAAEPTESANYRSE